MDKINNDFNAKEYINWLFSKGEDNIDFEYFRDEDLVKVSVNLNWSESDKNKLIDDFNHYFSELKEIGEYNNPKARKVFDKYFKDYNKNKFFEDLSIFGSRANHLVVAGCPKIIFENELKTSINLLLLNHFATKAFFTREVCELVEFDNKDKKNLN